ncbi:MYCBP-associated protein isoform X2 [Mastacembelus armatus]|uniref:MYCBP-associated protein isoform X2 n=1 Tax=Mastacembelus armatus TaxID=205130 RepID=UPI000E465F76|nr:MYCBP-associated protein isoform X2 [Mastacembelus armatus]
MPKPPKGYQKPVLMACVDKAQPADDVKNSKNLDPDSAPLAYTVLEGIRFDHKGMVLPHSILGNLEDFRSFLEANGETELVKRLPKSKSYPAPEAPESHQSEVVKSGIPSGNRNIQGNALQHWHTHMKQRRRQQDILSDLFNRPVENLLMNQANHYRKTQEQREFLSQVMPHIHYGYGYSVGSEFWSIPQHYGDEMSGIAATLTQTEQGKREPVTHVGQPSSILQESGILRAETLRPTSRTWDQSAYLQHQREELRKVLRDIDTKKPDINGLEVIGSGKPFASVAVCCSPLLEKEEEKEQKEMNTENLDPLPQYGDVHSGALLIPALRFCGQLATWTGNSTFQQGEVGINATILFEAATEEGASSHLELHNNGSTAIFYRWQQVNVPRTFPKLQSKKKRPYFNFNSPSGVILPGDTQQVELIFKSEDSGIKTEIWKLNTHPVLLQGASMQVTLKAVAIYPDKTADQKHLLELQYFNQPVEDLKRLWEEVNPGCTWDLSVDTLRQVILSLPEQKSAQDTKEKSLTQLNSLLLQLSEPCVLKHHPLTAAAIGQQLWKKLLDRMAGEAMWLRNLLGLPETKTWIDKKEDFLISDTDLPDDTNKGKNSENKGGTSAKEERSGAKSGLRDESKSATTDKSVEESKKKGKKRDEMGKGKAKEKQGKESVSLTDAHPESNQSAVINQPPPDDQNVAPEVMNIYRRFLHRKVYALMEDLVDTLCDLLDERDEQDTQRKQ